MTALVGRPTGQFSKAGKPMFRTPEGEDVSEKSISIPMDDKVINIPSIHKGVKLSEDEIMDKLKKGRLKPTSTHDTMEEAIEAAKERSKGLKKGGKVSSASSRADGCAIKGKTKGRMI